MAKPVGPLCNLDCRYCYYLGTADLYDGARTFRMSDAMLETYIRQYIEASPGPIVHFGWHGGEPTLPGPDYYRRVVELQHRYLPKGWQCWNNLQTNGTLLDEAWCAFLAEARFDVGISIDGDAWLHDANRPDHAGRGTYERVAAAIRRLQAHGIQPDLLCTITAALAAEPVAVYRNLRTFGTGWIHFLPIVRRDDKGQMTPETVTPEAYGRFLRVVFDQWMYQDIGRLNVQFFAEVLQVWSGGSATVCWMQPTCGRVLVVEHDGAVYSCDHYVTREHRIGDIATSHLGTLVDLPVQQQFGTAKSSTLPAQCRACRWLKVCNGGCPKDRLALAEDGSPGLNYLCAGLRAFYAYAEGPARHIIARRRAGAPAATVMAELREMGSARWSGIGRNDPCPCGSGRKAKQCCWNARP
ncbi:MAG: anaerobic sulfatase maturase [Hyphomicrobiales bacterium]|nr:anaerobic sulfatase maturase [Hyphomicrobiales bacterium]